MDGMESMASLFEGFFGSDPFMGVNQSGVCACSRVLQTRWLGISTVAVPVRQKIEREAENPSQEQKEFQKLQSCVKVMDSLSDQSNDSHAFEPILFRSLT